MWQFQSCPMNSAYIEEWDDEIAETVDDIEWNLPSDEIGDNEITEEMWLNIQFGLEATQCQPCRGQNPFSFGFSFERCMSCDEIFEMGDVDDYVRYFYNYLCEEQSLPEEFIEETETKVIIPDDDDGEQVTEEEEEAPKENYTALIVIVVVIVILVLGVFLFYKFFWLARKRDFSQKGAGGSKQNSGLSTPAASSGNAPHIQARKKRDLPPVGGEQ